MRNRGGFVAIRCFISLDRLCGGTPGSEAAETPPKTRKKSKKRQKGLAAPKGAGRSTFYHAQVKAAGLRFVNADALARALRMGPYEAAKMADSLRRELIKQRESFVFETVFSILLATS